MLLSRLLRLSVVNLCVCLCLEPQRCHFCNVFHISCCHQQQLAAISLSSRHHHSTVSPHLPTSAIFSFNHVIITEVCVNCTLSDAWALLLPSYDCSFGVGAGIWIGYIPSVLGGIQVYIVNYIWFYLFCAYSLV